MIDTGSRMPPTAPLVSVVTPTRNRPDVLLQALESVRQQNFERFEVIVIDDGSTHGVRNEYARIWKSLDPRFRLVHRGPAGSPGSDPGAGRNHGIEMATGEFVAFLDHDDFWIRSDHLSVAVNALSTREVDYLFANVRGERNGPVPLAWAAPYQALLKRGRGQVIDVPLSLFSRVMRRGLVHPSHSVVRRSLLTAVGGFARELKGAFDINIMLRLADRARGILFRPEVTTAIRIPTGRSYSDRFGEIAEQLGIYQAAMHARTHCRTRQMLSCARGRQAWALRRFADGRLADGQRREALTLAVEALAIAPTAGAVRDLVRLLFGSGKGEQRGENAT